MGAEKFTITIALPEVGKVQHVIIAASSNDAIDRLSSAYPDRNMGVVKIVSNGDHTPSENGRIVSATRGTQASMK